MYDDEHRDQAMILDDICQVLKTNKVAAAMVGNEVE